MPTGTVLVASTASSQTKAKVVAAHEKHFDAAPTDLEFLFQVLLDSVLDLHAPYVLAQSSYLLVQAQDAAIVEPDVLAARLAFISAIWKPVE